MSRAALLFSLVPGLLTGCLKAWVFSELPAPYLGKVDPPAGLSSISAQACAGCHGEIYDEWAGSAMGRAWTDPVFQADFRRQGEPWVCRNCHTPVEQQRPELIHGLSSLRPLVGEGDPNPDYDEALRDEGVTCAACHVRDGAIEGPFADSQPPHAFRAVENFGSEALCRPCHEVDAPPFSAMKRPIADVVNEWESWKETTGRTDRCIDCHMPAVTRSLTAWTEERPARKHTFPGGWDEEFVRGAIRVVGAARTEGGITVTLENLAGHRVPTDDPLRALIVRARVRTTDGRAAESTTALQRVVEEPSFRERSDSTLLPGEVRTVLLPFPATDLAGTPEASVELIWSPLHNAVPEVRAVRPEEFLLATVPVR